MIVYPLPAAPACSKPAPLAKVNDVNSSHLCVTDLLLFDTYSHCYQCHLCSQDNLILLARWFIMGKAAPPPLPDSLSSRLQSSVHPQTGRCKHHPSVQLCELVQNNTRWVVRRKVCYKCGSRPKGSGSRHMPGKSVSHSGKEPKRVGEKNETSQRGRQLRRSSSLLRSSSRNSSGTRASSRSPADSGRRRERCASATRVSRSRSSTRVTRSRSASVGGTGRERSKNSSSRNIVRRSSSTSRGRVSSSGEASNKKEGGKMNNKNRRGSERRAGGRSTSGKVKSTNKSDIAAQSMKNENSYHNRALAFTQIAISEGKVHSQTSVPVKETQPCDQDKSEDFDESDPIIVIPNIHLDEKSLPPPPPRSFEEMNIHEHRLELRRKHIRQQRRERSRSGSGKKLNDNAIEWKSGEMKSSSTRKPSNLKGNDSEGAPATSLRKSRRDWSKSSRPRRRPDSPTPITASPVHPSLAVLTALENYRHEDEDEDDEINPIVAVGDQSRSRMRSSHQEQEQVLRIECDERDDVDDEAESDTSSISSASARQYQLQPESTNELIAIHPELKGVVSDPIQFPPKDVTVGRSRSRSKSRSRVSVDPIDAPEEREAKMTTKIGSQRLAASRESRSRVERRSTKVEAEKRSSREQGNVASVSKNVSKLPKPSAPPRSPSTQKTKLSSSARSSRHTSRSCSGRVRSVEAIDVSRNRISKSAERSPSLAKSSPALMEGKHGRSNYSTNSRYGRSPHTSVTQPESVSSSMREETILNLKDIAMRLNRKDERLIAAHSNSDVKPVTAIRISEDEKSHASSISAGSKSTQKDSSHFDDKDGDKSPTEAKKRNMLRDVRGGAKNIAVRGKSALGGLKGTSKKWQSALFM